MKAAAKEALLITTAFSVMPSGTREEK